MSLRITCPNCGTTIRVQQKHLGKQGRCPSCREAIKIPHPRQKARKPAAPAEEAWAVPSDDDFAAFDDFTEKEIPDIHRPAQAPPQRRQKPPPQAAPNKTTQVILTIVGGSTVIVGLAVGVYFWVASLNKSDEPVQPVVADEAPAAANSGANPPPVGNPQPPSPAAKRETAQQETPPANSQSESAPKAASSKQLSISSSPPPEKKSAEVKRPRPATVSAEKSAEETKLSLEELIDQADDGVVLIQVYDSSGQDAGLGSGFLIDTSGLVATNFHVIGTAAKATAKFRDGSIVEVQGLRAWDKKRDLAILQLEQTPEQAAVLKLAAATQPRQGSEVIAIGHPRGLQFTSTQGIINAVHHTHELPADMQAFLKSPADQVWIQTSSMINRGSSGGPLLNDNGEVVGINTWIVADVSFGFASHIRHLAGLMTQVNEKLTPLADVTGRSPQSIGVISNVLPEISTLLGEYKNKHEEFLVQLELATDSQERESLLKSKNPAVKFSTRLLGLAKRAKTDQTAFQALYFSLLVARNIVPESRAARIAKEATARLLTKHAEEKQMQSLAFALSEFRLTEIHDFLKQLSKKSPHREVQGIALFSIAKSMHNNEKLSNSGEARLIALLEQVEKEYADVAIGGGTLGEVVEPFLFARKYLAVGKEAPDIVGADAEGVEFRLSDSRGKVVMLDFWADWCPYCVQMYPHERLLVENLQNQPFVLLGVNSDEPERLQAVQDEKKVTWRSWADGRGGPIGMRWNIEAIPTIILIDHEGIIRHRFNGAVEPRTLDESIKKLLKNAGARLPKRRSKR